MAKSKGFFVLNSLGKLQRVSQKKVKKVLNKYVSSKGFKKGKSY